MRFAPRPVVYSTVPWDKKTDDNAYLNQEDILIQSPLYPTEGVLKQSFALRTSMNDDKPSIVGYVIATSALLFLFFLVWWVVKKVLVLEIEQDVKNIRQGFTK